MLCHFLRNAIGLAAVLSIAGTATAVDSASAEGATSNVPATSADDGWRRTASGWEKISDWPRPADGYSNSATLGSWMPAQRVDFHPAGLALLQTLATAAAFTAFSVKTQKHSKPSADAT